MAVDWGLATPPLSAAASQGDPVPPKAQAEEGEREQERKEGGRK